MQIRRTLFRELCQLGLIARGCRYRCAAVYRLDVTELRKRGGGLFGIEPADRLDRRVYHQPPENRVSFAYEGRILCVYETARCGGRQNVTWRLKRKIIEQQTDKGLYPYSAVYLRDVKKRHSASTGTTTSTRSVSSVCTRRFLTTWVKASRRRRGQRVRDRDHGISAGVDAGVPKGNGSVSITLKRRRPKGRVIVLQRLDKEKYLDIISSGTNVPYYTNSSQLPVEVY